MKPNSSRKADAPICRYGTACSRKGCFYKHERKSPGKSIDPLDQSVEVCMSYLAGNCSFGDNCFNRHPSDQECDGIILKLRSKPCRFGPKCWTEGCLYNHDIVDDQNPPAVVPRASAPVVVASGPVFKADSVQEAPTISNLPSVKIPASVWRIYPDNIAEEAFAIDNPLERFAFVNSKAKPAPTLVENEGCFVLDLHFQSTKTVGTVLYQIFPQCMNYLSADSGSRGNIWLIVGTGRHVPTGSHQARGGILYDTVLRAVVDLATKYEWLDVSEGLAPGGAKGAIRLRHKR